MLQFQCKRESQILFSNITQCHFYSVSFYSPSFLKKSSKRWDDRKRLKRHRDLKKKKNEMKMTGTFNFPALSHFSDRWASGEKKEMGNPPQITMGLNDWMTVWLKVGFSLDWLGGSNGFSFFSLSYSVFSSSRKKNSFIVTCYILSFN